MTDKKFTDEEIIKALMCHFNEELDEEPFQCVDCPLYNDTSPSCTEALKSYALDLINRQKAEIDKLKSKHGKLCEYAEKKEFELAEINADISWFREAKFSRLAPAIKEIKVEACKEFAEKLKEERWDAECRVGYVQVVDVGSIDEVLKEMEEEKKWNEK